MFWWWLFSPLSRTEAVLCAFAAGFFLMQDYVTLRAGLFEFRFKDVLLMPVYEPPLWAFYFMSLKRLISGRAATAARVGLKSIFAVVVTSLMFSLFGHDSHVLFVATACSTAVLFLLFHTATDLAYALCALGLGFIVELFGVSTGLWRYPTTDFLGMPYWFATMWISVGLLGYRFLIPASDWLAHWRLHRA
jgi:hypothetical protein